MQRLTFTIVEADRWLVDEIGLLGVVGVKMARGEYVTDDGTSDDVRMLLDGLGVADLRELHLLVSVGRDRALGGCTCPPSHEVATCPVHAPEGVPG